MNLSLSGQFLEHLESKEYREMFAVTFPFAPLPCSFYLIETSSVWTFPIFLQFPARG